MLLSVTLKTTVGMPKNMLEKWHYDQLILAIFDALFHPRRQKNTFVSQKHSILLHKITNWNDK